MGWGDSSTEVKRGLPGKMFPRATTWGRGEGRGGTVELSHSLWRLRIGQDKAGRQEMEDWHQCL